jgi:hypothetical protein
MPRETKVTSIPRVFGQVAGLLHKGRRTRRRPYDQQSPDERAFLIPLQNPIRVAMDQGVSRVVATC